MKIISNIKEILLIYCRVSSERQKNEGHGLDSQEHRCLAFAAQYGYLVDRIFLDTYSGGGDFMERPAMRELLAYIDANPHVKFTVVFDDLKRFARDTEFHFKLRSAFRARGITLKCLNYNFDESPEGSFVETIFAAQNQLEREQNKRQVIQKMKARLEAGYWTFHYFPGYRSRQVSGHGRILYPFEPEASLIKEGLEGFANGRFQIQADLQRFLQERGYSDTKANKHKYTYAGAVQRILDRTALYAGFMEYKPWEVSRRKGHHEPLISEEVMHSIEEKLSGRKPKLRADIHPDFPARGIVCCSKCLNPMTASWTHKPKRNYKRAYYRCNMRRCEYMNKGIEKGVMEKDIVAVLKKVQPKKQVFELSKAILLDVWSKKKDSLQQSNTSRNLSLEALQIKKKELLQRIVKAKSDYVIEAYESEIESIARQEADLMNGSSKSYTTPKDFETALESVSQFLKSPYQYWENGGVYEKRLTLKLVFSGNLVYDHKERFETADLCCVLKVFEEITTSKSHGVEMGVSKPRVHVVNK